MIQSYVRGFKHVKKKFKRMIKNAAHMIRKVSLRTNRITKLKALKASITISVWVVSFTSAVKMQKTQLFLFSDLAKAIALDEISIWRPNWDKLAWNQLYNGGHATKEVICTS